MNDLIEKVIELVKIPSISGDQAAIRAAIEKVKEISPSSVQIREFNFSSASPVLLLSNCVGLEFDILTVGHLDVVPAGKDLFIPRISSGRLYGRGSLDMKSSVTVNIEALSYSLDKDIRFGVLLTTDEETTSNGIKALMKQEKLSPRIVFDTDAGNLHTLCDKAKHPISIRIEARGKSAHSSRPWNGINAIERLSDCLRDLSKHFNHYEYQEDQPDDIWQDTMVVTSFNSPTSYNIIPSTASSIVNFRLTEKMSFSDLESLLQRACTKHDCFYEVLLSSKGVYMDISRPEISLYCQIAESVLDCRLRIGRMCGGTDARLFAPHSAIIMHSVDGANAHGDDEYVDLLSIGKLLEIEKRYIDAYISGEI